MHSFENTYSSKDAQHSEAYWALAGLLSDWVLLGAVVGGTSCPSLSLAVCPSCPCALVASGADNDSTSCPSAVVPLVLGLGRVWRRFLWHQLSLVVPSLGRVYFWLLCI